MSDTIRFTIDGTEVETSGDETIWQIAERMGRTTAASRVLLHRALARLGRILVASRDERENGETRSFDA